MDLTIIALIAVTFFATLIGGLLVIKLRKGLPFFFAFAAGSLISVAFLDILPESLNLSIANNLPIRNVMIVIVVSFFVYSLLEKFFATHDLGHHHGHDHEGHGHIMGPIGAGSLIVHSFLDGAAIGASYQVNPVTGLIVAFAVITHDFTDGINTVTVMLQNKQPISKAVLFLFFDAIAPIFGIIATLFVTITAPMLSMILAFFVGEFVYIGAATLMPETRKHASKKIILTTALGIVIIALLTSLI